MFNGIVFFKILAVCSPEMDLAVIAKQVTLVIYPAVFLSLRNENTNKAKGSLKVAQSVTSLEFCSRAGGLYFQLVLFDLFTSHRPTLVCGPLVKNNYPKQL